MRIAAFACGRWDRAQVVHFVISTSLVKLYFVDFGTFGYLPLSKCRMLIEEFGKYSKKAIRGALHGIRPLGNTRLWDFDITSDFIDSIRNKIQRIQIVKHHTEVSKWEDREMSCTLNMIIINCRKISMSSCCLMTQTLP